MSWPKVSGISPAIQIINHYMNRRNQKEISKLHNSSNIYQQQVWRVCLTSKHISAENKQPKIYEPIKTSKSWFSCASINAGGVAGFAYSRPLALRLAPLGNCGRSCTKTH
jgi:hypothetical protein